MEMEKSNNEKIERTILLILRWLFYFAGFATIFFNTSPIKWGIIIWVIIAMSLFYEGNYQKIKHDKLKKDYKRVLQDALDMGKKIRGRE